MIKMDNVKKEKKMTLAKALFLIEELNKEILQLKSDCSLLLEENMQFKSHPDYNDSFTSLFDDANVQDDDSNSEI